MTEPKFILLTEADIERIRAVSDIHGRLPAEWGDDADVSDAQIQHFDRQLAAGLEEGRTCCETVEIEDRLVAFQWAEILRDTPDVLNIVSLWTDKEHRRKGIALGLKTRLEAWATTRDVARILTGVDPRNDAVFRMNEKLGYRVAMIRMQKDL